MRKFLILLLLILTPLTCRAAGYSLFTMNAAAHGMAHAYVCRVSDASAIFYNPAALNRIDHNDIYTSLTWVSTSGDFTPALLDGVTFKQLDQDLFPANFYAAHRLSDRFVFGLGTYIPFGSSTEWPVDSFPARVSRNAELRTFYLTPSLGFQATPEISLGGGLDVIYADTSLSQSSRFPIAVATERTLDADDWDVGFNLAAMIETQSNWTFAVTYKSKVDLEMVGDVSLATPLENELTVGEGHVNFHLPSRITGGASTTFENWLFEGDISYTNWGKVENLEMSFPGPFLVNTVNLPRNYEDTWSIRLGLEYRFTDNLTFRTGYLYDESPVPDVSVDPILPDATRNGFTMGFSYSYGRWRFDAGYMASRFDDRSVPEANSYPYPLNLSVAGAYTNSANLLSFGLGYKY